MPKSAKFLTRLALSGFLLAFLLIFFSSVMAKTLDIIVGGGMGEGLECEQDSDCPSGQFCHQEQYYCVACNVPPYEWTGTACQCPEGTVEKDGKTCVECLIDTDCKEDYYCDTDINHCTYCKFPKIWQDNACRCPDGTSEQGGQCVCLQANMELDETTGFCECVLNEEKCAGVNFNAKECLCCPPSAPVYENEECRSCTQINPNTPIWDSANKRCVQCLKDADCTSSDGIACDTNTNTCIGCTTPLVWDASTRTCVECLKNQDCEANYTCNTSTKRCEPCPAPQTRPIGANECACPAGTIAPNCDCPNGKMWDENKKQCVALNCANLGIPYSGLRVVGGYNCRGIGDVIDNGFSCGFSRKSPGPGVIEAQGYFYAAKDGNYSFWANAGNNKYGDVRYVRLYLDGKLVYNATHGWPNGNFSIWVAKGLHTFTYQGDVYKRVSIGLSYDKTNAVMCNYGKGNPQCNHWSTAINPLTGHCDCKDSSLIKATNGTCMDCAAAKGYFRGNDNICYACSESTAENAASYQDCMKCSTRYWDGSCHKCPKGSYCPSGQGAVPCTGNMCCPSGSASPQYVPGNCSRCFSCSNGYVSGYNNTFWCKINSSCRSTYDSFNR